MKKMIIFLVIALLFFGCAEEQKKEVYSEYIYHPEKTSKLEPEEDEIDYVPPLTNYTTLTFFDDGLSEMQTLESERIAAIYAFNKTITFVYPKTEDEVQVVPWKINIKENFWIKKCNIQSTECPNEAYELIVEPLEEISCVTYAPIDDSCGIEFYPGTYQVLIDNIYVGNLRVEY